MSFAKLKINFDLPTLISNLDKWFKKTLYLFSNRENSVLLAESAYICKVSQFGPAGGGYQVKSDLHSS